MKINYQKVIENDFEEDIYINKHNDIINYITTFGETDFWTIINEVGGSERRMLRLLDAMVINKELIFENNAYNILNNECKYKNVDYEYLEKEFIKIWKRKPIPTLYFDQRPITYKSTIKRVKYMLERNDIYNKNIVFLGDDDLTSIALALANVECKITMLDIDNRLVDFVSKISNEYNLNIETMCFNAMDDTPDFLKHKFDCLFTDPTPEEKPLTIFLNKALDLLKTDNSIIYTSLYSSAMSETLKLQSVINSMNLLITDLIPNFTKYKAIPELYRDTDLDLINKYNIKINDDSICFTESLFRLKVTTGSTKKSIKYHNYDIFGKATKRVINDKNNDIIKEDSDYLNEIRKEMINNSNKEYISR